MYIRRSKIDKWNRKLHGDLIQVGPRKVTHSAILALASKLAEKYQTR